MTRRARPSAHAGARSRPSALRRATWLSLALLLLCSIALPLTFLDAAGVARRTALGRLVDAGAVDDYAPGQPRAFPRDDFYLLRLADGSFVAPYAYPPGFFGHVQGCRIRWLAHPRFSPPLGGPEWTEGCGGAIWDPSGRKLFGPGPELPGGSLDRFAVTVRFGRVIVDTRQLQCFGPPCERVEQPITQLYVTITDSGFQPARLQIPANRPVFVLLKNESHAMQNWHLVGVQDAAGNHDRWGTFTPPDAVGVFAAPDADIHTPAAPPGSSYGVPFMVGKAGTYTFQSDGDPTHLRGTASVR